ncbi:hypothetical protein MPTK1_5g12470 [Marchantia polymorpha subsp. ruderalis]|uniref:Uncharacterized protein n=2 Tax=Marchantia polymorpha TaxID=3197 RepID=A0AAF6BHL8_MARPO|nr:hypothetical protein MARPO_0092s0059 [Marchantia polymorpha]BBN11502.1 hypothetical protein Mp_5g12470 [Marchantia polymorpha subsp. ruderalis]|eukprot:PTQ33098.1 hypothetical protein MARPO_0092s0059 [Marchantia polymorpha]
MLFGDSRPWLALRPQATKHLSPARLAYDDTSFRAWWGRAVPIVHVHYKIMCMSAHVFVDRVARSRVRNSRVARAGCHKAPHSLKYA